MNKTYFCIYLTLISILSVSCLKNKTDNVPSTTNENENELVTVVLEKNDEGSIVIKDIKPYDEKAIKKSALESLEKYLSLPYTEEGIDMAYEMFYSKEYKDILARTRNVKNAVEYIESNPTLDFEFHIKISKVNSIIITGDSVRISCDTTIYDRVNKITSKAIQTFNMLNEDNKWVIN